MVIFDEFLFRIVDGQGFRNIYLLLESRFKILCCISIARDYMKCFAPENEKLKTLFKDGGIRITLTIDTWRSIQNLN